MICPPLTGYEDSPDEKSESAKGQRAQHRFQPPSQESTVCVVASKLADGVVANIPDGILDEAKGEKDDNAELEDNAAKHDFGALHTGVRIIRMGMGQSAMLTTSGSRPFSGVAAAATPPPTPWTRRATMSYIDS